jgi:hypothetical protein
MRSRFTRIREALDGSTRELVGVSARGSATGGEGVCPFEVFFERPSPSDAKRRIEMNCDMPNSPECHSHTQCVRPLHVD